MKTADTPGDWDTKNMGAGIADAFNLLRVPLPATAPAALMNFANRAPRSPDPMQGSLTYSRRLLGR